MGNTPEKKNAVVLTDGSGNWYAVPLEILEEHKVTGDRKAEVEKLFDDTASGYSFEALAPNRGLTADHAQNMADPARLARPSLEAAPALEAHPTFSADARTAGVAADASEALTQMYGVMTALPASLFGFGKK